jgi:hypothetical protein
LRETVAVGLARGVRLPPDITEKTLATMRSMPPHHTTSMGNDLIRGNRLELPWFAGKVVELGRRHSIPTPVNGFLYAGTSALGSGDKKGTGIKRIRVAAVRSTTRTELKSPENSRRLIRSPSLASDHRTAPNTKRR